MHNLNHYFPVIKWKRGEKAALHHLDASIKKHITPIIEIPIMDFDYKKGEYKKSLDSHLAPTSEEILKYWGKERSVYLDLRLLEEGNLLHKLEDGSNPMDYILEECRKQDLKIIPVTGTNREDNYLTDIKKAIRIDNLGVCIRIDDRDFDDITKHLNSILNYLNVAANSVDLMIDFKYIISGSEESNAGKVLDIINSLPNIDDWRTIILSSTSFPIDLSSIAANSIEKIKRVEWNVWELVNTNSTIRIPNYSDYVIANPEIKKLDPRKMRRSASIRYTLDQEWLILKGRSIKKYGSKQYFTLCEELIKLDEFKGQTYSWGDEFIYKCATEKKKPGSGETWRCVGTNHHITLVANQLSSLFGS